jgi:hypothetical protein
MGKKRIKRGIENIEAILKKKFSVLKSCKNKKR